MRARPQSVWAVVVALACFLFPEPSGIAAPAPKAELAAGPGPNFSPRSGVFAGSVAVKVESSAPGGVVRYTLDGSDPTEKSETVAGELRLTGTTQVRARVFGNSGTGGPVVSQTYTVTEKELESFVGNLPIVILNTFGREVIRSEKTAASIRVIDEKNGEAKLLGEANYEGRGELNLRGYSSLRYLKRSFSLKTRDDAGKAKSVSLLGFPEDGDWVLYAPYPDKTLLRDVLTYDLSRQMGRYASRAKFVEVFLNQVGGRLSKRHYMGVYVLEEKVKRGKGRVPIQKLKPEDNAVPAITGGYIFKKDHWDNQGETTPTVEGRGQGFGGNSGNRYGYPTGPGGFPADPAGFLPPVGGELRQGDRRMRRDVGIEEMVRDPLRIDGNNGGIVRSRTIVRGQDMIIERDGGSEVFMTSSGNEFFYVEPKADEITAMQRAWLRNHLNEFERVLAGPDFKDPVKGYAAYIDPDSFIDHHIIVELTKNIDGFRFSTFFQKDRGGKIKMEPIWDWNLSYGNANGKQGQMAEHWYWPQLDDRQYSYYRRLFEDPDFAQRYVDRLAELRATVFSISNVFARIDALVTDIGGARSRNFERWPILSRRIWPNTFVGKSYDDEIGYMKGFIDQRFAWVDKQFVPAPSVTLTGGSAQLSAQSGKVYYTTDGSDPRASGGSVSAKAQLAGPGVKISGADRIVARALVGERWSAPLRR